MFLPPIVSKPNTVLMPGTGTAATIGTGASLVPVTTNPGTSSLPMPAWFEMSSLASSDTGPVEIAFQTT